MAAADRFTDLSDDLLASVISFLPTKDAACTSVLSRRWRWLWLGMDALNLDSRSYGGGRSDLHYGSYGGLDASRLKDRLLSDACAALRAAGRCPVRKLSLFIKGHNDKYCHDVISVPWEWSWNRRSYDLLVALLDVEELQRIEELRLGFHSVKERRFLYELDPAVLPCSTIRVLDLAYTRIALPRQPGGSATFLLPCLTVLRLHKCSARIKDLEDFIRAAPSLGSLHIEFDSQDFHFCSYPDNGGDRLTLHCPSVTTVTLTGLGPGIKIGIEIDAPCLRSFKYDGGGLVDFSMKSPTPELTRVEVALTRRSYSFLEREEPWFSNFWRIIRNFQHAKILKMKVPNIEGIAVREDVEHEHLVMLLSLERLELEGPCDPNRRNDTATAIANLLQCCPVIHDLQIRIVNSNRYGVVANDALLPHFDVSMDLFKRRYTKEVMVMIDGDIEEFSDAAEFPGLSGCEFDCFRNHLKNVKLEFVFKEFNSFEVSLARFLSENCMAIAALQIVDGHRNFRSHIDWMVERWRANAGEQRKQ